MKRTTLQNLLLCLPLISFSCSAPKSHYADDIVAKAIAAHGGEHYEDCVIEFDFRGRHFTIKRNHGQFSYSREFDRDGEKILDVLTNEGFQRFVNGQKVALSARDSTRFASSTNSVAYFALLPFPLNDPAAVKVFNRAIFINDEPYYEIGVTFKRDGGGKDFEDEFVYWFHQEHFTMDYLAYRFNDSDDGTRFRHATRQEKIGGILLADYDNHAASGLKSLQDYPALFEKNELEKVSEIVLKNASVKSYQ